MAESAFTDRLYADPIKPTRCTTGFVGPMNGINKDVNGVQIAASSMSALQNLGCTDECPV